MKKGRCCRSWTFSPKRHSKVRAQGAGVRGLLTVPNRCLLLSSGFHGKNQKWKISVYGLYQFISNRKAEARRDCSVPTSGVQVTITTVLGREGGRSQPVLLSLQPCSWTGTESWRPRLSASEPCWARWALKPLSRA